MKPKVIALCNQKGGVTKSTTTFNLGVCLAKQNKRVLLIDADPQSSLTVSMGYTKPDNLKITLSDIMQNIIEDKDFNFTDGILNHQENVDLMPASISLSGTELNLFNAISRETVLKTYVNRVKQNYDYVLIDSMPSLGIMTINTLAAADSVIIPTQPNYLSAKGLDLLLQTISKVKRQINPNLKIDGILFAMVDSRTNEAKEIISSLRYNYGEKINIYKSEIPFSVRMAEASGEGISIFSHDKSGKVAKAYENLTQEVQAVEKRFRADTTR